MTTMVAGEEEGDGDEGQGWRASDCKEGESDINEGDGDGDRGNVQQRGGKGG